MTSAITFRALRRCALLIGASASVAMAQDSRALTEQPAQPGPGELVLSEVLARAAEQHPLVEAARARVSAAHGARRTAGTLPNPVLTYSVENLGRPGGNSTMQLDRESQASATLPLEPLFQRWSRIRGADEDVYAADADLARARQVVALGAARAFYRVAAAQVAVDGVEEIRARLAELVTFNQARVAEGVTAEADLIRIQLELDRVTTSATLERVELARARAELAPYVAGTSAVTTTPAGQPAAPRIGVLRVVVEDAPMPPGQAGLPALATFVTQARTARPDLIAARARVSSARAAVGYQRALTVRQVGATIGTKRTAGVTSLIAGVSLPFPIFDQNRGEVQRASGERTAIEQELAWAERQAVAEVEAAYEAAQLLTEQANRLRGSFLGRAEESRRIALAAYQEGAVSLLQVLDASRTLADARLTYYRTLFAQRQSLLELQAAVGAGPLDGIRAPATPIPDMPTAAATPLGEVPVEASSPSASPLRQSTSSRPVRPSGDRR